MYGYTRRAIEETIRICKDRYILKEFLEEHEKEVVDIMISLYSQDEIYEMFIRDAVKEGKAEGRAEEKENTAIVMIKNNFELSVISTITHLSLDKINEIKTRFTNSPQLANE